MEMKKNIGVTEETFTIMQRHDGSIGPATIESYQLKSPVHLYRIDTRYIAEGMFSGYFSRGVTGQDSVQKQFKDT